MSNYCHASCGRCSSVKETILSIVPAKRPAGTPAADVAAPAQANAAARTESADVAAPAQPAGACADIVPPMAVGFNCDQAANLWSQVCVCVCVCLCP